MKHFTLIILFFISILNAPNLYAEERVTLSGYVKDGSTGEALIGASVTVKELSGTGTITNVYGFYSLSLPQGNYNIVYSFIGYENQTQEVLFNSSKQINIELSEQEVRLHEVVVTADRPEEHVTDVKMSRENLKIEKIKSMPALFGEVDILKSIQLLPGIQSAGEGTTGLFVRGGSADQNLVMLDGATVYNASHFMGFFSVFNPDAIKNIEIYKGGIPAQFGGRLSSILDIQMNEGNNKCFSANGGLGSISSRLTVEGPIVKDKSSFIISGRRTYADVFLKLSPDDNINSNILYFYDLNAKANYQLNDKNQIFLSGYFGRDVFKFDDVFGLDWGNATTTLRWNHLFNDRLFLNTTFLFSQFDYGFKIDDGVSKFDWKSNLRDYSAKLDFSYFLNPKLTIAFGSNSIYHQFSPAEILPGEGSIFEPYKLDEKYAFEQAFYVSNDHKITEKLSLQYGLRYSLFSLLGPGKVFLYEQGAERLDNTIVGEENYDRLENIKLYHGLEPRFGARYMVGTNNSLKASYNRTRQYLQIASNSTAGLPIDRWIPADTYINPLIGDQVALGYFHNLANNTFETSVEVYYKWMQNVVDFKPAAELLLSRHIETELYEGKGWAYGSEFMIKKNTGRTTGWVSYTLARTQRQIEGINDGKPYNARYDRTHDVAVVLSHQLSPRLTLAANWVYSTGSAVSLPSGLYETDGKQVAYYDDSKRNAYRMPDYHRMDISATLDSKPKPNKKWQGSWNFSIYNAYARKNAFSIMFQDIINNDPQYNQDEDGPEVSRRPGAVKVYLFSLIPSVTYNFKFNSCK